MQPRAQALGKSRKRVSPEGAKERVWRHGLFSACGRQFSKRTKWQKSVEASAAGSSLSLAHLQHRQERLLGDVHPADALHAFFAFLLLFEELAFTADIAAIAFC